MPRRRIGSSLVSATDLTWFSLPTPAIAFSNSYHGPTITRPEQLKGKKVGTGEANSSQDRITRQTLQRLGLNPDRDVTLVPFGSRSIQRLNALLKGEIDATTSNEDNFLIWNAEAS